MRKIATIAHLPLGNRSAKVAELVHLALSGATYLERKPLSKTLKIDRPEHGHNPPACLPETCEENHAVAVTARSFDMPMSELECRDYLNSLPADARTAANNDYKVIAAEIDARAKAKRPSPKAYEIHHEFMVAGAAFLTAHKAGENAFNAARKAVGLPELIDG